ncbi:MAG: adenosylcobinamide-GDP ribazoletransferase [Oscillospiraceae bacterium]
MNVLKSFCSAFSMYSVIPMPKVKWCEENRRYSLCFFPLIGLIIGGLLMMWRIIYEDGWFKDWLFAAVACIFPLWISGDIHMDGYCDVLDAEGSHADRSRRLEIMSDPHIGSFAAVGLGVYIVLQFGLFTQVDSRQAAAVVALGYTLSRALSGLAAVTFKSAKSEGTLQNFVKPAHRAVTITVLAVITAAVSAGMVLIDPIFGAAALIAAGGTLLFYRIFAYKRYGGITGDLAGFFLQLCELAILAAVVIATIIARKFFIFYPWVL